VAEKRNYPWPMQCNAHSAIQPAWLAVPSALLYIKLAMWPSAYERGSYWLLYQWLLLWPVFWPFKQLVIQNYWNYCSRGGLVAWRLQRSYSQPSVAYQLPLTQYWLAAAAGKRLRRHFIEQMHSLCDRNSIWYRQYCVETDIGVWRRSDWRYYWRDGCVCVYCSSITVLSVEKYCVTTEVLLFWYLSAVVSWLIIWLCYCWPMCVYSGWYSQSISNAMILWYVFYFLRDGCRYNDYCVWLLSVVFVFYWRVYVL